VNTDAQIPKDGLLLVLAADRIAGMRYSQIAEKHGISVPLVRQRLRKAMMKGVVSAEQIRYKPIKKREPMPEGDYNAKWIRRVLANVEIDATGCWLWKGFRSEWGYAQALYRNRTKHVHRQMYKVVNSVDLTRWQFVMHKCDTPHCVNPAHLVLGTPHDNVQDAADKGRHHNARKTECKRGHAYTDETVYVTPSGTRACKVCKKWREEQKRNAA
jgi:DNA-binding Lrp family transcriptional regulator